MNDRIEKTIDLRAPIDRVWRALTDPAEFGAWFMVKLDDPFVPGQPARGHTTYPGFEHMPWEIVVAAMDKPRLFAFTWHPYAVNLEVDYSEEPPTLIEFKLEPISDGTRLTLVESGFDALPAYRGPIAFQMDDAGWTQQVKNIRAYVER
jgi:uncharacterized protein YndB with AHSA1/START domain